MSSAPHGPRDQPDFASRAALICILVAGAAVRLFHLETPSLWWDEILVPLTSSRSLEYILDFCRSAEMHPPLFYLVSKALLGIGASDFALRIGPALLGMGSIHLLYKVTRSWIGEGPGLLAAALLSVNGLHILLSREIRPYALQLVLLLLAWRLIARLVEEGRWRDLLLLCLVDAALFWLHYFTFHMAFAQGVVLFVCLFNRSVPVDLKRLAVFCGLIALAALPVFLWFFLPSSGSRSIFTDTQYTRWDVLRLISQYLGQAAFFFDSQSLRLASLGLMAAGLILAARRHPRSCLIGIVLAAVPLANVLAMGKAAYFSPWHVAYVTPFMAFFGGLALSVVPWPRFLAAALALVGAGAILATQQARFYQVDSYRHHVFVTLFKPVARELAVMLPRGGPVVSSNPGFANGVSWYLDQYSRPNPLRAQSVPPGGGALELRFVSAFKDFGVLGRDEAAFLARTGQPVSREAAQNATLYLFRVDRQAPPRMESWPFTAALRAGFAEFYAGVRSLKDAVYCPMPGVGVTPTDYGVPGVIEWVVDNPSGQAPLRLFVNLGYRNAGLGNTIGLFASFDDEPPVPVAGTLGPDHKSQVQAIVDRDKPFKRLTFRLEMINHGRQAQYHGGSLELSAFRSLELFACPPERAGECQAAWERSNMQSMRLNYVAEAFARTSATAHRPLWDAVANLEDASSSEVPGWRVLSPKDPARPGVLTLEASPDGRTFFFPRVSGPGDSVLVFEVLPDGSERPVFMMAGGEDGWTPISARYPLVLPPGEGRRLLRVELRGRFSQLWHRDGAVLF